MAKGKQIDFTRTQLGRLVKQYFDRNNPWQLVPERVPLSIPSYNWEEVCEVLESLLSGHVTMGRKVREFEIAFAEYIGVKHAIMVNSGSSANLVALSVLACRSLERRLEPGDEIIVPATLWSTTVFPVLQIGATPVFVDVEEKSFNLDPAQLRDAITPKTKAIIVVHLLGNPANMAAIKAIAEEFDLFVIEDACEAHGAMIQGKKVGSFGHLATFSFFFSHHISTIEGGLVLTDDDEFADLARSVRAHGWVREMAQRETIARRFPDIDDRFLFVVAGYNLRPTEIQGAFGIHQIRKLESYIDIRRTNASLWNKRLGDFSDCLTVSEEREGTRHVWFAFPVIVKPSAPFARADLVRFLERKNIETRPIMVGNMVEHPAMRLYSYKQVGALPHARYIAENGFLIGNHHGVGSEQRAYVIECMEAFINDCNVKG